MTEEVDSNYFNMDTLSFNETEKIDYYPSSP